MGWARITDTFDDETEVLSLLEYDNGAAAVGLWTVCFTWASRNRRPDRVAHVPAGMLSELMPGAGDDLAELLVQAGLWATCDDGWIFVESDLFEWGPMDGRRSYIPKWLRRRIHARDGGRCLRCGRTDDLTLDHIWPWSLGGRDTEDNLRTLCRSCNSKKGARV